MHLNVEYDAKFKYGRSSWRTAAASSSNNKEWLAVGRLLLAWGLIWYFFLCSLCGFYMIAFGWGFVMFWYVPEMQRDRLIYYYCLVERYSCFILMFVFSMKRLLLLEFRSYVFLKAHCFPLRWFYWSNSRHILRHVMPCHVLVKKALLFWYIIFLIFVVYVWRKSVDLKWPIIVI